MSDINPVNVYNSIHVNLGDQGELEFNGNGCITVTEYDGSIGFIVRLNRTQLILISKFLASTAKGKNGAIGEEGGEE